MGLPEGLLHKVSLIFIEICQYSLHILLSYLENNINSEILNSAKTFHSPQATPLTPNLGSGSPLGGAQNMTGGPSGFVHTKLVKITNVRDTTTWKILGHY